MYGARLLIMPWLSPRQPGPRASRPKCFRGAVFSRQMFNCSPRSCPLPRERYKGGSRVYAYCSVVMSRVDLQGVVVGSKAEGVVIGVRLERLKAGKR